MPQDTATALGSQEMATLMVSDMDKAITQALSPLGQSAFVGNTVANINNTAVGGESTIWQEVEKFTHKPKGVISFYFSIHRHTSFLSSGYDSKEQIYMDHINFFKQ